MEIFWIESMREKVFLFLINLKNIRGIIRSPLSKLASSSRIISWINFHGVLLTMLTSVRNKVEFPSLWKTIIIDVLGNWRENLEWALQLYYFYFDDKFDRKRSLTLHFWCRALHDLKQFDHWQQYQTYFLRNDVSIRSEDVQVENKLRLFRPANPTDFH